MELYQQQSSVPGGYVYLQLPRGGPSDSTVRPTFVYATIGAALGILVATAIAAGTWTPKAPETAPDLGQVSSSAVAPATHPAAKPLPVPEFERKADNLANAMPSSSAKPASGKAPSAHIVLAAFSRHVARVGSAGNRGSRRLRVSSRRMAHAATASVAVMAASSQPVPVQQVTHISVMIEGDVTLADFDAAAGLIETREGMNFLIARTEGDSNAMPWQDFPANVHYRCDRAGSCTLFHAGVVLPNARLTGPDGSPVGRPDVADAISAAAI